MIELVVDTQKIEMECDPDSSQYKPADSGLLRSNIGTFAVL